MMAFLIFTSFAVVSVWLVFLYNLFTNKIKLSLMYGYLAVTHAAHALASQMIGQPFMIYLIFSAMWMVFHLLYKRMENNSSDSDINKKEKDNNEL